MTRLSAVGLLIVALTSTTLVAQNWPQWRGPNRDGTAQGVTVPSTWPEQPKLVWKVDVGVGHSSPVVADGRAYAFGRVGEEEIVSAVDLETGKVLWSSRYAAPYRVNQAAMRHGPGPKSTPLIYGGTLYTLGISGILSAFDLKTGAVRWKKTFAGEFKESSPTYGAAMSPLVVDGLLIAHLGTDTQGALTAFDAESGAVKWRWGIDGPAYASPIVVDVAGTRQIITQTYRSIVSVSTTDGAQLWQLPFKTDHDQNIVTPLAIKDVVVFSGLLNPTFAVRVARKGATWAPIKIWENANVSMYMSSPVLRGDVLVGLSHRNRGQFFGLSTTTGQTLWTSEGRQADNAAIVAAGDTMFLLTSDAELVVAKVTDKGMQTLRRYTIADSPTWAHPIVLGSRVLIKDEKALTLFNLAG